jgi:hypothetical protein
MVPVPVRRSTFVSLHPEHAELNVEVSLGGIAPFGATTRGAVTEAFLQCDLEDNPDTSMRGRLGSGRTGVYRGKYLKGVGRTLLAGNWANTNDVTHHTGLLHASSGIRELLVSAYLRTKGCGDAINGCEGVLLKLLPPEASEHMLPELRALEGFAEDARGFWTADLELQSLTVKRGGFVRFSNLVWLSNHLDFYRTGSASATTFARFVRAFLAHVDPEPARDDATPDAMARAFYRSFDRGLANMRRFWKLGVSWSSLHNNFSTDGRFVDIDRPVILGRPLVGIIARGQQRRLDIPHRDMQWGLFEPLFYVLHMRMLARFFEGRLRAIAGMGYPVSRREREYAREAARSFAALARRHLLFSRERLRKTLIRWVADEVALDLTQRRALAKTVDQAYRSLFTDHGGRTFPIALEPVPAPLARLGATNDPVAHVFAFMKTGSVAPPEAVLSEDAAYVNRQISDLCQIGDRDRLLSSMGDAVKNVLAHCRSVENVAPRSLRDSDSEAT